MPSTPQMRVLLVLLAGAAGCLDAASFLELDHVFTANMTGNTVLLGLALGQGAARDVVLHAAGLAGFLAGAFLGVRLAPAAAEPADALPMRVIRPLLVVEGALALVLAAAWAWRGGTSLSLAVLVPIILLAAGAMGVQSAMLHRLHFAGVSTTALTGTLTTLVAHVATRGRAERAAAPAPAPMVTVTHDVGLLGGIWLLYVVGAVVTVLVARSDLALVFVPPAVLLIAALVAARRSRV